MDEAFGAEAGRLLMAFANSHNTARAEHDRSERPPPKGKKSKGPVEKGIEASSSGVTKPKRAGGGGGAGAGKTGKYAGAEESKQEISRLKDDNSSLRGKLSDSQEQVTAPPRCKGGALGERGCSGGVLGGGGGV